MSIVFVIIAAICLLYGFLAAQSDTLQGGGYATMLGIVAFIAGALLHMRKRRNEQLDAMRGRRDK